MTLHLYTLLSAASITGTFADVTGLPANYAVDYTPTSILLIPTPEPASLALLALPLWLLRRRIRRIREHICART